MTHRRRIATLRHLRLTASRFSQFAACSGALSHCLPRGSGKGIVPAQNSTLESGWVCIQAQVVKRPANVRFVPKADMLTYFTEAHSLEPVGRDQ